MLVGANAGAPFRVSGRRAGGEWMTLLEEAHWPAWREARLDRFLPGIVDLRFEGLRKDTGDGAQLRELRLRVEEGELPAPSPRKR